MYNEIQELYEYCKNIGINATLKPLHDGYIIKFPNGSDVVQHRYSYGCCNGCVEPAISSELDFTAVSLEVVKEYIEKHKERLNNEV